MGKYGKYEKQRAKKRRSWGFAIFMVLYALVVLGAAAWGLIKFWDYLDAYEQSRIQNPMDAYMAEVTPAYVCDRSSDLIDSIDHQLQMRSDRGLYRCMRILLLYVEEPRVDQEGRQDGGHL